MVHMELLELFLLLPLWYQWMLVLVLGLIVGSFLNVAAYRFNTGRSFNGASHCLSCAERLRWFELLPVVSYVALRGRCRHCSSRIPIHYLLGELVTASLFGVVFTSVSTITSLLFGWLMVSLLMLIIIYDIRHLIIPDELVIMLFVLALGVQLYSLPTFTLFGVSLTLTTAVFGALATAGVYWSLWWYSSGRWMGLGDAKLALPLGFMVGVGNAFSLVVLSFWVGAIYSLVLLGLQRLQAGTTVMPLQQNSITIKSEVPFAPFIVLAFLLVYFLQVDVLSLLMF